MKIKQVIILAVILLLLIIGILIKQRQKPAELATEEYSPLALTFPAEAVAGIYLAKPKADKPSPETAEVVKENGVWRVKTLHDARADQQKIQNLLDEILKTSGELRSRDKALFPDFGIADTEAYQIILKDSAAKELLHLRVGIKKPDFQSLFVRENGSEEVYLTQSNLLGQAGIYGDPKEAALKGDYWVSMNFGTVDSSQVKKLEIRRFDAGRKENLAMSVIREENPEDASKKIWKYTRPYDLFVPDAEKIRQFLDSFKGWPAQKVEDPKSKNFGFDSPVWKMTLGLEGSEVVLTAGKMDPDTRLYPVQVSTEPVIYQVPMYYFINMDQDDSRFFADNFMNLQPDKVSRLTVHTPGKEISLNPKEQRFEALNQYLNDLQAVGIKRLANESEWRKVKSPAPTWLEIQLEGGKFYTLDIGEKVPGETEKMFDYLTVIRGNPLVFVIAESAYKRFFENLDALTPPPAPAAPAEKKP